MKSYLDDPRHWRDRAEATRAKADWLWKDLDKQRMMRIAAEYDRIADGAAERQRSAGLPNKE